MREKNPKFLMWSQIFGPHYKTETCWVDVCYYFSLGWSELILVDDITVENKKSYRWRDLSHLLGLGGGLFWLGPVSKHLDIPEQHSNMFKTTHNTLASSLSKCRNLLRPQCPLLSTKRAYFFLSRIIYICKYPLTRAFYTPNTLDILIISNLETVLNY